MLNARVSTWNEDLMPLDIQFVDRTREPAVGVDRFELSTRPQGWVIPEVTITPRDGPILIARVTVEVVNDPERQGLSPEPVARRIKTAFGNWGYEPPRILNQPKSLWGPLIPNAGNLPPNFVGDLTITVHFHESQSGRPRGPEQVTAKSCRLFSPSTELPGTDRPALPTPPLRGADTSGPEIPTQNDIATLPRWARVAYAARCVRRVLPLFGQSQRWREMELYLAGVERAVGVAERSASAARVDPSAGRALKDAMDAKAAAEARAISASGDSDAVAAASVARAAAAAVASITTTARAVETAYAARAAGGTAVTAAAIRKDYDLLRDLDLAEGWTDETPVPPEIFGPIWPDGPPTGWPVEEPTSENQELAVTIEVPAGMTEEEILDLVAGVYRKADAVHRAYGGSGLYPSRGQLIFSRGPGFGSLWVW